MAVLKDITGQKFGKLTVIKHAKSKKGYHGAMWECVCECGNTIVVNGQNLKSGNTTSCGCIGRENRAASVRTHGMSGSRLHRIWKAMHTRCYNPNSYAYKYYGGRGIQICDEWKDDFQDFYRWSMSHGYAENLTIDRINTNGNYEPNNCRWTTIAEQNKNKRAKNGYKIKED